MEKYKVDYNYCSCHPETCCCDVYALYIGNSKITTSDNEDYLESVKQAKILEETRYNNLKAENVKLKKYAGELRQKIQTAKSQL